MGAGKNKIPFKVKKLLKVGAERLEDGLGCKHPRNGS